MIKLPEPSASSQSAAAGVNAPTAAKRRSALPTIIFLLALTGLIVAAYSNVLFNFFLGDDFGLLIWIKGAMQCPQVFLRDFTGSWLASTTAQHYRPLISVTVLIDHLLYGFDATGFHLTNVLSLVATAICFYFIVARLLGGDRAKAPLWPCFAALLFGLYPLHAESISWIIGRVDSVCVAFYLASFMMYMRWRASNGAWSLAASLVCMGLSLLSKEMGIIIPATLAAYELIVVTDDKRRTVLSHFRHVVVKTAPFWLLLAVYFVVRRLALGTFFGSYDDSPLVGTDASAVIHNWQQGLRNLVVVPANREIMGSHNILVILWQVCLVPSAILLFFSLRQSIFRRSVLFCLLWFALSLVPVYKLFAITDILQNSRYGYLATAPLCALLTLGFADAIQSLRKFQTKGKTECASKERSRKIASSRAGLVLVISLSLTMLVSSFLMLRQNNSAWAEAGVTTNAISSQLQKFYNSNPGDPPVLLVNVPDSLHGCYVCRNAAQGMTQTPILSRDHLNCSMIDGFDRAQPFGYLKSTFNNYKDRLSVLAWNQNLQTLRPVSFPAAASRQERQLSLTGAELATAVTPHRNSCKIAADANSVVITAKNNKRAEVEIALPHTVSCFPIDLIEAEVQTDPIRLQAPFDLEFTNDIFSQFGSDDLIRAFSSAPATAARQTVIFSLRSHPTWSLGGETNKLLLRLPAGTSTRLLAIDSLPTNENMPLISFPNSDWLGSKGIANFSRAHNQIELQYDASGMQGAAAVRLELSRRNMPFEWPNSPDETTKAIASHSSRIGTFIVQRKDFPDVGMYELRCRAVDGNGKNLGVAGDHILAFVNE